MRSWVLQHGCLFFVLTALPAPTRAAECPPGRVVQKVVTTEDAIQTFCKCDVGYIPRDRVCIHKLPEVDPAFFVSAVRRQRRRQRDCLLAYSERQRVYRRGARLFAASQARL
jgi:hypothetical protein